MGFWKKYGKSLLALLMIVTMLMSTSVTGTFADEKTESTEDSMQESSENIPEEQNSEVELETETSEEPYTMKVTFDGAELSDTEKNVAESEWKSSESKTLQVQLTRNANVSVDADKRFILCMKVSPVFYFNGLPDINGITGADECEIKQNEAPKVYPSGGRELQDLPGFSNYSGEIRIALNTAVDTITIPNMSIGYNQELSGYYASETTSSKVITVQEPLKITLTEVSNKISDLTKIKDSDKKVLKEIDLESAKLTRNSVNSGLTNASSLDGFISDSQTMKHNLSTKSTIAWAGGTAGINTHYSKELVIVFHCPYIKKDDKKYYLSFSTDDKALKNNSQKDDKKGYHTKSVEYDAEKHTITYNFENVYLTQHQRVFYTPVFSWPDDLSKDITTSYPIEGYQWEVTKNIGYADTEDNNSGWRGKQALLSNGEVGTFDTSSPEISLVSSANPGSKSGIAKRLISNKLTRENGADGIGILGFFDVHNDGAIDSPEVKISIDFNTTGGTGAKYYVTKVNLPASSKKNNVVSYTLADESGNTITGELEYTDKSSFTCDVSKLRGNSNVGDNYYIKSLGYTTILKSNWAYHRETAHLNRNRYDDSGLFYGYLEGDKGKTANAVMTIESTETDVSNNLKALTKNGDTKLQTTETSTVSEDDFIGYTVGNVLVNKESTTSITAGNSATVQFGVTVSNEEYKKSDKDATVNGYHIFRNGIFYLCLPQNVSISGNNQVKVICGGKEIIADSVRQMQNSKCEVGGTDAYWWEIKVNGINANALISARQSFQVQIQLATDLMMSGVTWNFNNCLAVRPEGQAISWVGAGTICQKVLTVNNLENMSQASAKGLGTALLQDTTLKDSSNIGMNLYQSNTSVNLNIVRAEAKLDVTTDLYIGKESAEKEDYAITDPDTKLAYNITVSSKDGGSAENFSYYIPIVSKDSVLNSSAWVEKNEFGMALQEPVNIKAVGVTSDDTKNGFSVYYTTDAGLSSENIRNDSVNWLTEVPEAEYSKITAVKIASSSQASIKNGETLQFQLSLKYDNSNNDFYTMAGAEIEWKTFGHYSYNRNGEETTNTYPSGSNAVKIRYENDLTKEPTVAILDTSSDTSARVSKKMPTTFKKEQNLKIKNVALSDGTQLISEDPKSLSGAEANQKFRMYFNLNNALGNAISLQDKLNGGAWTLSADSSGSLLAEVTFSKALTDVTTPRYVDITFGNDDINIIWRIQLDRKVASADATKSGVIGGEQFKVPNVGENVSITQNSALSALYVINNYVPANYTDQKIYWKTGEGEENAFPEKTQFILMEISGENKVKGYWHYTTKSAESSIDLKEFVRMGADEKYKYDTTSTSGTTLRYLLVVDFENAMISNGDYKIAFCSTAKSGAETKVDVALPVTVTDKTTYTLKTEPGTSSEIPTSKFSCEKTNGTGDDNYSASRTLALVLTEPIESEEKLPKDAVLEVDGKRYRRNKNGQYIIPVGTATGDTKTITIHSDMFPDEGATYSLKGQLYLYTRSQSDIVSPLNGDKVGNDTDIQFTKAKKERPSLKVKGTQVATATEWKNGQEIEIDIKNIPEKGSVTVTVYNGIEGSQKVTDLLSSIAGVFEIADGIGTYNSKAETTGKLVLSGAATPGTYELKFEIKEADGKTVLTVPYDIIVIE